MDEVFARDADMLRDPHRRWLRHTYQEGPGFRFLAARGGRPPGRRPSRREIGELRRRARVVRIAREQDITAALALANAAARASGAGSAHTRTVASPRLCPSPAAHGTPSSSTPAGSSKS